MANLTYKISTFSQGSILVEQETTSPYKYNGWRCLHNGEPGSYQSDQNGMPEIRPGWRYIDPRAEARAVNFTGPMQLLEYELNGHNHEYYTGIRWRNVHRDGTAFNNRQGYGNIIPRRDYVNRIDLTSKYADGSPAYPKYMKQLICGGTFTNGEVVKLIVEGVPTDYLKCVPGVHGIDVSKAMPSIETVMNNNWYFVATTCLNDKVSNFPQGGGKHVRILRLMREETVYPLSWFDRWVSNELPDPLKLYNPK